MCTLDSAVPSPRQARGVSLTAWLMARAWEGLYSRPGSTTRRPHPKTLPTIKTATRILAGLVGGAFAEHQVPAI